MSAYKNAEKFKEFKTRPAVAGGEKLINLLISIFNEQADYLNNKTFAPPIKHDVLHVIYTLIENSVINKGWIRIDKSLKPVFKRAIHRLQFYEFVEMRRGSESSKLTTRIRFTEKWYKLLNERETRPLIIQNKKFVEIRNGIERPLKASHPRVAIIERMLNRLEGNKFETNSRKIEFANVSMRVNEVNEELGRVYIYQFQSIDKEDRKTLRINNESTSEIDFHAFHPTLLYKSVGINLDKSFDVYAIDGGIRALTKLVFLIALNEKGGKEAVIKAVVASDGFNDIVYSETLKQLKGEIVSKEKFKELMSKIREELTWLSRITLSELYKKHKPISHLFGTGVAKRCFYLESQIVLNAISELIKKYEDIVIIPIHDSLIVQSRYAGAAEIEMSRALELYRYNHYMMDDAA